MSYPLFIYGTLHPDRAPAAIASSAKRLTAFSGGRNRANVCGRLHDLGAYPGVILSNDSSDSVVGELFLLPETSEADAILAQLDEYEDFRPSDPASSLFIRQLVRATLLDGERTGEVAECWVYVYNRPVGMKPQ